MGQRTLRIISNMRRLGDVRSERFSVAHQYEPGPGTVWSAVRLFFRARRHDVVVLNNDSRRLMVLCLLRWFVPFQRSRLVSVDILLPRPVGRKQRIIACLKRVLLKKVDLFILYFVDLEGYRRYYGISPDRACYVPFKVNSWEMIPLASELSADGEYVFTGGRTLRDLPTFMEALREIRLPGLLLYQGVAMSRDHGTAVDLSRLPPNVRLEEHNGDPRTWLEYIMGAKVVVVPTLASSISATGISTYLVAMALKKCVIVTEGPATRSLIRDEAIVVRPNDPIALAEAIHLAWEDKELRERTATAGRRYAERIGGECRLLSDIVDACGTLACG